MTHDSSRVLLDLSAPTRAFKPRAARKNYIRDSLKAKAEGLPGLRKKIARLEKRLALARSEGHGELRVAHLERILATQKTTAWMLADKLAKENVNIPVPDIEAPKEYKSRSKRKQRIYKMWSNR